MLRHHINTGATLAGTPLHDTHKRPSVKGVICRIDAGKEGEVCYRVQGGIRHSMKTSQEVRTTWIFHGYKPSIAELGKFLQE